MVRLLLPLLPYRLAGLMVSTGSGWLAVSLYLGGNRFLFLFGKGIRADVSHWRERFPTAANFARPVIIRFGRVRNA